MASVHTHLAAGALTGASVAVATHMEPAALALFTLSTAGSSLIADIDIDPSAVTNSVPRIFKPLLIVVRKLAIKHRGLTHVGLAAPLFGFAVYAVGWLNPGWPHSVLPQYWPIKVVVPAILTALAVRSLLTVFSGPKYRSLISKPHRRAVTLLSAMAAGYLGASLGAAPGFSLWLAMAVGVGYLTHPLCDAVFGGVPLFWPLVPSLAKERRFTLARIPTGGKWDHIIGYVTLGLTAVLIAWDLNAAHAVMTLAHLRHL